MMGHSLSANNSGCVIWITGLSGSGKSTLANAAASRLHVLGFNTIVLDGDEIRQGLSSDLGFSLTERHENVRRVGEVAKILKNAGWFTFVALISPMRDARRKIRSLFKPHEFIEIWCRCPVSICESRDIKNLYHRARQGEISDFTGITSVYENPENPELIIDSEHLSVEDCLAALLAYLKDHGYLNNA
jgi:adenylylsulfate kinase